MPVYKKVNKDFFKKWSLEMAYVLGFFAADGYITVNRRGGQFWSIQIIDKKLLENIKKVVGSGHKIGTKERFGNESAIYRLQIGSIEMCDDLRKLGYRERKTKSLAIPFIPDKYFTGFVRGYFDGDGNVWVGLVHKKSNHPVLTIQTCFTSCSKKFLANLQNKLLNLGLGRGSLHGRHSGNTWQLSYSKEDSTKLYRLMYLCYPVGELYLQRKRKVFERFLRMRP